MHTMGVENEEGDPVRTAWCKFHGLLQEWEEDTPKILVRIGMPLDICCLWAFQWEYFEEFADALGRGVRDILH
jgi:hypothetical protein